MEKYQKALAALVVAMLGISIIYFYAASIKPVSMAPGDIKATDEGKLVRSEGAVGNPYIGNRSTTFDLVDPWTGGMVKVFVSFDLQKDIKSIVRSGTLVSVQGEVKIYKEKPEIEVKDGSGLKILGPPGSNEVRIDVLAANRDSFDNMTVSIAGRVKGLSSSFGGLNFTLYEGQSKAVCRVSDFTSQVPFSDGSRVRLIGRAWYDEQGYARISASGWTAVTVEI